MPVRPNLQNWIRLTPRQDNLGRDTVGRVDVVRIGEKIARTKRKDTRTKLLLKIVWKVATRTANDMIKG